MADLGDGRTTERLHLRPPVAGDSGAYRELLAHPVVGEWLRPPPLEPFGPADGEIWLEADRRHWAAFDFGPWAVLDRADGSYLGRVGLRWTEVEGQPAIEVLWAIAPERHGEGLATEAAAAAIELARERGIEEVIAMVLPSNTASLRVAEKAGLTEAGRIEHAGLEHVLFRHEPASEW